MIEEDDDYDMVHAIAESLRTNSIEDEELKQAIHDSQAAYLSTGFDEEEELRQAIHISQSITTAGFDEEEALRQAILNSEAIQLPTGFDDDEDLRQAIDSSKADAGESEELMFHQALLDSQSEYDARPHKMTLLVPRTLIRSIIGKDFCETNKIATRVGYNCKITARHGGKVLISADTADALSRAEDAVLLRCSHLSSHQHFGSKTLAAPKIIRGPLERERFRHVFIDNSNIYLTAKYTFDGSNQCNNAVRLNVRGLTSLLEQGGTDPLATHVEIVTRLTAGSKPPINNGIWKTYQSVRYRTEVHSRDHDTGKETAIDSIMHGAALQLVSERGYEDPGANTLVLATGDGNDNGGLTSFPKLAIAAATAGFRVEIWSWQSSLNKLAFEAVRDMFSDGRVSIHYLDPYKLSVCYLVPSLEEQLRAKNATSTGAKAAQPNPPAAIAPVSIQAPVPIADDDECSHCMERPRNVVLTPCGHFQYCLQCVEGELAPFVAKNGCPLCCRPVSQHIVVFR